MNRFETLSDKLAKCDLPKDYFFSLLSECEELEHFEINSVEDLRCLGLNVEEQGENIRLLSRTKNWREENFCIVDIETNNLPTNEAKVIEVGAVMLKNCEIIDSFHSLIYTDFLPENIIILTGITPEILENAPSEASVLEKFRMFLKTSVFVAHNVDFDYTFLSHALQRHGFPPLLNRKLCTIKLARKTIESQRYGLQALREALGINDGVLHRALDDAKSAAEIFKAACKSIPKWVETSEDLIEFTKSNKNHLQLKLPFEEF